MRSDQLSQDSRQPPSSYETGGNPSTSTYMFLDLIPCVLVHLIITTDQLDLAARADGSVPSLSHGVVDSS